MPLLANMTLAGYPVTNDGKRSGDHPTPRRRGSFWPGAETRQRNPPNGKIEAKARCDGPGTALAGDGQGGAGAKPAGKRLATEKRHRVDTDLEAKGLPPHDGGKDIAR